MLPRVNLVRCNEADYLLFATNEIITSHLYFNGSWESHLTVVSRMFHSCHESPLILDIGANLGAYAIPIAKEIQALNGTIYSYEPQRIIYYQLCGNIFFNRLDNVFAFCKAIGDVDGTIAVPEIDYFKTVNIGGFSLDEDLRKKLNSVSLKENGASTETPIAKLDSIQFPKSPCLIKIDAEGFDLKVLKGGVNFLENNNFPPILFEAWSLDWYKEEKEKLFSFLKKLGYEIGDLLNDNYVAQHPKHSVCIEFSIEKNDAISMNRIK